MKIDYLTPMKIAEVTGGQYFGLPSDCLCRISGAVRDNRDVREGNLFVCIRGAKADGHNYADLALKAGASCCLAERELPGVKGPYVLVPSTLAALRTLGGYHRRRFNLPVIGVTGSVGKTTAKEMIASALASKYSVLKTPENLNNEIGVPLTLLSLDNSHEAAVIEMGISEFGEMSRLSEMVRPDICVMTKIGYSHLETLGNAEGVLKAKSEIYKFMKPGAAAVVNGDDEYLQAYDPGITKTTFGISPKNDLYAENITADSTNAVACDAVGGGVRLPIQIPAFGSHHLLAALPAVITGRMLGLTDEEIAAGLRSYVPVGGRANVHDTGFITLIDDCYNANPNSVRAALAALVALRTEGNDDNHAKDGRRVAILGDMKELGRQSDELHHDVGALAREYEIDLVICCGESAKHIYRGARGDENSAGTDAEYFTDKTELLSSLKDLIRKDDTVLVKASRSMGFEEVCGFLKHL